MKLPLEDQFGDILSKAQKGLGISTETLAKRSGLSEKAIRSLRRGEGDRERIAALARELGLRSEPLRKLAQEAWYPQQPDPIPGFEAFATPFYDWSVNAYALWNADLGEAVAFDTGTEAAPILDFIQRKGLRLVALCLTHTHRDHVEGLAALREAWDIPVFVHEREAEAAPEAQPIAEGFTIELAGYSIRALETPGHTDGGTSFLADGLSRPLAIVGDALFAGSMGGASGCYETALASLDRLLELPEDTALAPGHGPLTSVAEERQMNCFWRGPRRS